MRWNKISSNNYNQNVNFPNYYPRVLYNGWDGRTSSRRQLMNEFSWSSKNHARYASGDNVVNRQLIQTWIPTCLHDLIYCLFEQGKLKRNQ
ncbi:Hypothetical protein SRAE_1000270500 [Strongyloides ratti]|uniref:Uncharacterized protein n=1 Tax=Strongyloides ratti TaxID=34506 RepID=A0A090L3Q4_STRRB|nr:Hypothetical protein SRAE_1000270500 [Strongyloides ratti]CEF64451.1 Hypothetical protein SRAE_1000270500 [Strongyloides ratti]